MNTAKQLREWVRRWPATACVLSSLTVLFAALFAVTGRPAFFLGTLAVVAAFAVTYCWRSSVSLIAAAAFLSGQFQARAGVVPIVVGAAVIVAGTVVTVKFIRYCERRFPRKPKETNAPPEELWSASAGGSYAGLASWGEVGSCVDLSDWGLRRAWLDEADNPSVGVALTVALEEDWRGPRARTSVEVIPYSELEDGAAFQRDLAEAGLPWDFRANRYLYAQGGQPAGEGQTPLFLAPGLVAVGYGGPTLRVQWSDDAQEWRDALSVQMPVGYTLRVEDVHQGDAKFWRVEVSR